MTFFRKLYDCIINHILALYDCQDNNCMQYEVWKVLVIDTKIYQIYNIRYLMIRLLTIKHIFREENSILASIKQKDFEALNGIPLIWTCIEPTIQKVRGKNALIKLDAYSQLTKGQQALLMFQVLYGHTLHGVEEFFFHLSYMLSTKGTWSQMINGMKYYEANDMVNFLDEMYALYEKFREDAEQNKVRFGNVEKNTPLFLSLSTLNTMLNDILPSAIELVCSHIKSNPEQYVQFID